MGPIEIFRNLVKRYILWSQGHAKPVSETYNDFTVQDFTSLEINMIMSLKFHEIITSLLIPHHSYRATCVEHQNTAFRLVIVGHAAGDASSEACYIFTIAIVITHVVLRSTRQSWHNCLRVNGFRVRAVVPMTSTRLIVWSLIQDPMAGIAFCHR